MVEVDDLIFSLTQYLNTETFTCKDLSGAAELKTGLLTALFPNLTPETVNGKEKLHIVPVRFYTTEQVAYPAIGIAVQPTPSTQQEFYGSGSIYTYMGRFIVLGTKPEEDDDPDTPDEADLYQSVLQTMQMGNALMQHFTQDDNGAPVVRTIPWLRYTYNDTGDTTVLGAFGLTEFRITPVDDNKFVATFILEVGD